MGTTIENRGCLPPEVMAVKQGYMETSVDIITNDCILAQDNSFPTTAEDWTALNILAGVDAAIAKASRKERREIAKYKCDMRAEQRRKAKQRRIEKRFEIAMTAALCTEILAAIFVL